MHIPMQCDGQILYMYLILPVEHLNLDLNITLTSQWAWWRLKSSVLRLVTQRLFRRRSKTTSKLRVTGLCAGNSPLTGEFPAQKASNAENVSIWWRHHELKLVNSISLLILWSWRTWWNVSYILITDNVGFNASMWLFYKSTYVWHEILIYFF